MKAAQEAVEAWVAVLTETLEGEHSQWLTPRERSYLTAERRRAKKELVDIEGWLD